MKKFSILFVVGLIYLSAFANDGAFFAKGNQLIPIAETQISIQKEILYIKNINHQSIEVIVYYEFFNPGNEKTITVGFEAFSPSGDANGTPLNGQHPYMRDFTVELNDKILSHKIAYVNDDAYAKDGVIKTKSLAEIKGSITDENNVDFYYVYHFDAPFKKGLNKIKHTYTYDLSGSIEFAYEFEYVLTAANRWANKQIDDFTLIIDMGALESFTIENSFFTDSNDWLINGIGKSINVKGTPNSLVEKDATKFYIQKGNLIFQKKNFKPASELFLYNVNYFGTEISESIPFALYFQDNIPEPSSDFEKRILKNLPFARRGYVFKSTELQTYFEKLDWYIPNPNYTGDVEQLTETEKAWIKRWQ